MGQAVDQEQNKASHGCQTLSPNKQCAFSTLSGEDTQTQRCQPQGAFPLPPSFSSFIWFKITFGIIKSETPWAYWKFTEGKIWTTKGKFLFQFNSVNESFSPLSLNFSATLILQKTNSGKLRAKFLMYLCLLSMSSNHCFLKQRFSNFSVTMNHTGVSLFLGSISEFLVLWALGGASAFPFLPSSPGG